MAKKLAVFCDGTWNSADQCTVQGLPCPTNVSRLFEATMPYDQSGNPQIAHYIQGVGTRKWDRLLGGGFGLGISDNIVNGYQFLVSNYEPGDDIFIFGFSRGAYTARSLAGLIHNFGILKRNKLYRVPEVFNHYRDESPVWHPGSNQTSEFRKAHCYGDETVKCIGVWDTVGALGAPFGAITGWVVKQLFNTQFHDVKLSSSVLNAYHALAIDERRWPFRPTLWERSKQASTSYLEQKWFPGVHSNVGGGYPNTGLADLTLQWMADKAQHHGLSVNLQRVANPPVAPNAKASIEKSQTWWYRLATLFSVKLPSRFGWVYPKDNKPLLEDLHWNGDYVRPLSSRGNIVDYIGASPKNGNLADYSGDVDVSVVEKINTDQRYRPPNVLSDTGGK